MRYFNVFTLVCLLLLSTASLADQLYAVRDGGTVRVSISPQALNHLLIWGEKIIGFQGSMGKCPTTQCDATLGIDSYGRMYLKKQPGSFFVETDQGHLILVIAQPIEGSDQFIVIKILP